MLCSKNNITHLIPNCSVICEQGLCILIFPCLGRPDLSLDTGSSPSLLQKNICAAGGQQALPTALPTLGAETTQTTSPLSRKPSTGFPFLRGKAFCDVVPAPCLPSSPQSLPSFTTLPVCSCVPGQIPASGPLHCSSLCLECSPPDVHMTHHYWALCSDATSSVTPFLATWSIISAAPFPHPSMFKILSLPNFYPPACDPVQHILLS